MLSCCFFFQLFRLGGVTLKTFNQTMLGVKRKLAVNKLVKKCDALKNIGQGLTNKEMVEKYGVLHKNHFHKGEKTKANIVIHLKLLLVKSGSDKKSNFDNLNKVDFVASYKKHTNTSCWTRN